MSRGVGDAEGESAASEEGRKGGLEREGGRMREEGREKETGKRGGKYRGSERERDG